MPLRHSLDALAFRHTTHCSVLIPFREKHSHIFEGIFRCFFTLSERAKTHKASCKKYKPYILKYKALISKYVPCIFREKRHLIFNDLQNRKNSVFPHRCARKKNHPKRNVHIPANRASFSPSRRTLHTCRLCLQSSRMPLQKHRLTLSKRQVNLTTTFYISTF